MAVFEWERLTKIVVTLYLGRGDYFGKVWS